MDELCVVIFMCILIWSWAEQLRNAIEADAEWRASEEEENANGREDGEWEN